MTTVLNAPPVVAPRSSLRPIVAVIQARLDSSRLPGKVLADIGGQPMLWRVVSRVQRATLLDRVIVATSQDPSDDPIAAFCAQRGVPCVRGSKTDVLSRYVQAAQWAGAETVVRVTADCPLIDPAVIDRVVAEYLASGADYVSNVLTHTYPDGLDLEVFAMDALERSAAVATLPAEREHVTLHLRTSGLFTTHGVEQHRYPQARCHRWTVDEPQDLALIRAIYSRFGEQSFGMDDVLALFDEEPEMLTLNHGLIRNEGYYRSLVNEPMVPPQPRSLARSAALKARAERVIPSVSQTFSKAPTQYVQGVAPVFLARGHGSHVWDVDGNEYIDFAMGLGPVILGHNDPAVTEAVTRQASHGAAFTLPHYLEVEVAELLIEIIPCAEMARFGKNGSDATAGAVRVARAYTGRDLIACCGYHGWQDWFIGTTTRNAGVPGAVRALTKPFPYNDIAALEALFAQHPGQIAAVVMEPIGVVPPNPGYLEAVRELTTREGALLIFDEVVTGFRLALGGAQELFGVTPDLGCFGKALGNGYPIAAVVGRRDVMAQFDDIFFSFTAGGEAVSLAAAQATVRALQDRAVIPWLWELGQKLQDGYTVLARAFGLERYTACVGLPPRTVITFTDDTGAESLLYKSLFQQECLKRGVLFSGAHNLCAAHTDADILHTLRVYRTALEILADAIRAGDAAARLEGPIVQPVFRRP